MPMLPKRTKFRKQQRGSLRGNATRGNYVAFGDFGLQSLEAHWLTARQIEAGRIAAQHFLRRQGKIYIRVFPDKPVSKKPLETRMGKGKAESRVLGRPSQARNRSLRDLRRDRRHGEAGVCPYRSQDARSLPIRRPPTGRMTQCDVDVADSKRRHRQDATSSGTVR